MKKVLLWICVLPITVVASILAYHLSTFIGNYSLRMFVYGECPWTLSISRIVSSFFMGFVFVIVGTAIAPTYKKYTAIILAAMILILATSNLTIQIVLHSVEGFWEQAEVYVGSILAVIGGIIGFKSTEDLWVEEHSIKQKRYFNPNKDSTNVE